MLRTRVIATNITNLTDARYFAAWGVDYLSFVTDSSRESYVTPEKLKEIADWVEGPQVLLSFEGLSVGDNIEEYESLGFRQCIIGPFVESPTSLEVAFRIITMSDLSTVKSGGRYVLNFDSLASLADISVADGAEIFLDGNFQASDIEILLSYSWVSGIVLRGGDEQKVGVKTYEELDDIMEVLECFE